MRTYLILKAKAKRFNTDEEIQGLLAEINAADEQMIPFHGSYSSAKAQSLKIYPFNRKALGERGKLYERLDQLTIELLLGVR